MVRRKSYSTGTPTTSAGSAGIDRSDDLGMAMWTTGACGKSSVRLRRRKRSASSLTATITSGGRDAYFSRRYVARVRGATLPAKAGMSKKLVIHNYRPIPRSLNRLAEPMIDLDVCREQPTVGIQDEDVPVSCAAIAGRLCTARRPAIWIKMWKRRSLNGIHLMIRLKGNFGPFLFW